MNVVVNGETRELPDRATVAVLLERIHQGRPPQACAVEVNKRLIPKAKHPETALREGDTVEVVTLVGGG